MEPQLTISVDKEKAAEYGYTVAQVYQLVSAKMADSKSATTISTDIKDYKVYVQTQEQTDTKLDDIRQMTFTHTDKDGKEYVIHKDESISFPPNEGRYLENKSKLPARMLVIINYPD